MANIPGYLDYTNVANALARGAAEGASLGLSTATVKALERIEKAVVNNPVETKKITLAANQRLAHNMRTAVLHSYDQVVTARKKVPSYRHGEDRFAGKLRGALESDVNYVATANGIKFIDIAHMDETAAHWYRLNFGAAPQSGRPPYAYNLVLEGGGLGPVELAWAPSEPFRMPAGFFTENGEFWPSKLARDRPELVPSTRIGRNTPTRGIAARRFLDAGLDRLSKDFNEVYGDVLIQVRNQKLDQLRNI